MLEADENEKSKKKLLKRRKHTYTKYQQSSEFQ